MALHRKWINLGVNRELNAEFRRNVTSCVTPTGNSNLIIPLAKEARFAFFAFPLYLWWPNEKIPSSQLTCRKAWQVKIQ